MAELSKTKKMIKSVFGVTKPLFHWGFIPFVIYLGLRKGGEPGMPAPSLLSVVLPFA